MPGASAPTDTAIPDAILPPPRIAYESPVVDYSILFAERNMSLEQATRFFWGGNNPRSN